MLGKDSNIVLLAVIIQVVACEMRIK